MTHKNTILDLLKDNNGAFCDDCISKLKNILPRQTVHKVCSSLAAIGYLSRSNGMCSSCGKNKKVSRIASADFPEVPYSENDVIAQNEARVQKPWYWEGNLQVKLATWLASKGYKIISTTNTESRSRGVDIIAEDSQRNPLWISIKGYPDTSRHVQPRHYIANAIFDLILYRGESASVQLGIGLPAGFTTYNNLAKKVQWMRKEILPFDIYWINEHGQVQKE
jgi:hypothetical protein